MSDSEIDDVERFQQERDESLYQRAGLGRARANDDLDMSDEEIMAIDASDDDDAGQEDYYDAADSGRKDRGENWGSSRNNYYGGDDYGDEEGAQDDEEEEALRLQQEQAEELGDDDFYDDDDMEGWKRDAVAGEVETEELPQQDISAMSAAERLAFVQDSYPEVILLANELKKLKEYEAELADDESTVAEFQKAALSSYMGMIYAYFALFSDKIEEGPVDLKSHPVMEGILKARQLWETATQIQDVGGSASEDEDDISEAEELVGSSDVDVSEDEQPQPVAAAESGSESSSGAGSESGSEGWDSSAGEEQPSEEEEDDFTVSLPKLRHKTKQVQNDFDETADTVEQQARAKNRQSLRFYTAQIDKKSAPKEDKFAGDLDLPYKERAFERRQRLIREARERGQQEQDRLGESEEDEDQDTSAHNAVYEKARAAKAEKKNAKRERHADAVAAAKQGKLDEYLAANPNVDKRAINYQIQKNKGLTPKRKKENRNARVKKRVRFAEAQKKLKSVRRVYQTPSGPYAGEMSGIKKNLVHSTKFSG